MEELMTAEEYWEKKIWEKKFGEKNFWEKIREKYREKYWDSYLWYPSFDKAYREYWDSGPNYFDRMRNYLAVKDVYLDSKQDYLEKKVWHHWSREAREREILDLKKRFLAVKKDFLTRKREYVRTLEDYEVWERDAKVQDFHSIREFFLARTASRTSLDPDFFRNDVFLSFRGPDVRNTLVNRLSEALSKAGLRVFLDSKSLNKGAKIWPSLESAIGSSAIRIPVFSEGYADSTWCLKEAAEMLKTPGLIVPLFYDMDPSDVRYPLKNSSPYKKAFTKHYAHPDRQPKEEIDRWKISLGEICSRSGWAMGITEDSEVEVERIVKDVIDMLHFH
ncbi:disease resistance protein RPV1-like [Cryptomeria japonica]|uniref:disease resistance protein RPV1-like n=1 Tax=Cryptomeria japonica TaxID=3369 RepID=UPI0027DA697D|nr:disease resistance protein RPV1-like [Cryptomeria japonica]